MQEVVMLLPHDLANCAMHEAECQTSFINNVCLDPSRSTQYPETHWLSQIGSCRGLLATLPVIKTAEHDFVRKMTFWAKTKYRCSYEIFHRRV